MNRIEQYLAIAADPDAAPLSGTHEHDGPLRSVLIHVAFADGIVGPPELALLERLVPGLDRTVLLDLVSSEAARPLDLDLLARTFPGTDERHQLLAFAAAMVWEDDALHPAEEGLMGRLQAALG